MTETNDVKEMRAKWKIPWVYHFAYKQEGVYTFKAYEKTIDATEEVAEIYWYTHLGIHQAYWNPVKEARWRMEGLTSRYQFLKMYPNSHRIPDKQLEIRLLDEIEQSCRNLV